MKKILPVLFLIYFHSFCPAQNKTVTKEIDLAKIDPGTTQEFPVPSSDKLKLSLVNVWQAALQHRDRI